MTTGSQVEMAYESLIGNLPLFGQPIEQPIELMVTRVYVTALCSNDHFKSKQDLLWIVTRQGMRPTQLALHHLSKTAGSIVALSRTFVFSSFALFF